MEYLYGTPGIILRKDLSIWIYVRKLQLFERHCTSNITSIDLDNYIGVYSFKDLIKFYLIMSNSLKLI